MNNNNKNGQEKLTKLSIFLNRYYRYIIIILSLLILIPAFFFWLRPKYLETISLSAQQLPLREKRLVELKNYYQQLDKLASSLTTFEQEKKQEIDKLTKILPQQPEIANLFAELEALIKASGFTLKTVSFTESPVSQQKSNNDTSLSNTTNDLPIINENTELNEGEQLGLTNDYNQENIGQNIGVVDINISIEGGGYLAFKALLTNIENNLRLMDVTTINFGDINVDEVKGEKASYVLTLRTYYLP